MKVLNAFELYFYNRMRPILAPIPPGYGPTALCTACKRELPRSEFHVAKRSASGIKCRCRHCANEERRVRRQSWRNL